MKFQYKPVGVCSQMIEFEINDNKVENLRIQGGCNGNGKGLSCLVEGMNVDDVIDRLEGIKCGFKSTSCPDQLSKALTKAKSQIN